MERLRAVGGVISAAVVVVAILLPAQATATEPGLPFESTSTEEFCGLGARVADSTNCGVVGTASAASGAVSAQTRLISPAGGTAAWTAEAVSDGRVIARYHLAEPVRQLDFIVSIHVHRASVTLSPGAPGPAGYYLDPNAGRRAHVDAGAHALHSACSDCGGGTNVIVLSTWKPGTTVSTSAEDVVFHLKVSRKGGNDLPPGDVTVRAGVGAPVWQTNAWGDDSASVDAVVTKIALS